jgi:hypothetical protein
MGVGNALIDGFETDPTCSGCTSAYAAADAATQKNLNGLAGLRTSTTTAGIAATTLSTINKAIAMRTGTGSGAAGGCLNPGGSVSASCTYDSSDAYLTDSTCKTCFDSVYAAMTDFQKGEVFYPLMNAAASAAVGCAVSGSCRDADADEYLTDSTIQTVNAYSEATLTALGIPTAVTSYKASYAYVAIATRAGTGSGAAGGCANPGGSVSASCTFDANLAFLSDSTCQTCYAGVYGAMSDAEKTAAYQGALISFEASVSTSAEADAHITTLVR